MCDFQPKHGLKQRTKKAHTYVSWRSKNVQKRTKADEKGLQCKSTLVGPVCSNCTRLRYETNTIRYLKQITVSRYQSVNIKLLIFSQKYLHLEKCASLNPARIGRIASLTNKKRRLTPTLQRIGVLNCTNKVVMCW